MSAPATDAKSIFGKALELELAARAVYLDETCAGNPLLRARIEGLLNAHGEAGDFMHRPAAAIAAGITAGYEPLTEGPGSRIGPYKLLQEIGEGGMGVVYMAEQTEPVRRRVALKIIKPGMDSAQVVARFEAERQALALMDHQNIAKVLDAGTTDSGRPFFAMELVHGVPITRYCDDNHLTPRERLELFVPVCQAIQHAHQKGIIHRDVKPSNVMVCLYDGKPVPKVIDFGVAKAVEQRLTERTMFTQYGAIVGTFEYMAPEQAEMSQLGVDTRSDIYSLGVLLYELLTGSTPLERKRLRQAALDEVLQLIREEEPPRPSTRITQSKESLAGLAAARRTEPAKLSRLLRGELDWIVMKALEKDRTRRYETANGLASDLQRYLADEPVKAGAPSAGYKLRKFARKHRAALATATAFAALLLIGGLVSVWQAVRATQAKVEAEENERQAKAVLEFFQEKVLKAARPKGKDEPGGLGTDVTVRQALDAAVPEITKAFRGQPLREASVRYVLGENYRRLRDLPRAIQQLEQARDLLQDQLGANHRDTLACMHSLAEAYGNVGQFDRALTLAEETLQRRKAKLGPEDIDTLKSMLILAEAYSGLGQMDQALPLFKETLQLRKVKLGPEDIRTLVAMGCLGNAYLKAGMLDQAVPLLEETLKLRKNILGPEEGYTLQAMTFLVEAYDAQQNPEVLRLGQELLTLQRRALAAEDPALADTQAALGLSLLHAQQPAEAEPLLRSCLAVRQKQQADLWTTSHAQSLLGACLLGQKKYAEAEPLLLDGYHGLKQRRPQGHSFRPRYLAEAVERLVQLYEATRRPDEAAKWRKELEARQANTGPAKGPLARGGEAHHDGKKAVR
jgi:serine/threonine protein kinase